MKISIEIEKGDEGKHSMGNGEESMAPTAFQKKVAKMLAQMAGRKTPNEVDMETAKDFEEDDIEYKMAMKGMKK
jgi:hypothetical protein